MGTRPTTQTPLHNNKELTDDDKKLKLLKFNSMQLEKMQKFMKSQKQYDERLKNTVSSIHEMLSEREILKFMQADNETHSDHEINTVLCFITENIPVKNWDCLSQKQKEEYKTKRETLKKLKKDVMWPKILAKPSRGIGQIQDSKAGPGDTVEDAAATKSELRSKMIEFYDTKQKLIQDSRKNLRDLQLYELPEILHDILQNSAYYYEKARKLLYNSLSIRDDDEYSKQQFDILKSRLQETQNFYLTELNKMKSMAEEWKIIKDTHDLLDVRSKIILNKMQRLFIISSEGSQEEKNLKELYELITQQHRLRTETLWRLKYITNSKPEDLTEIDYDGSIETDLRFRGTPNYVTRMFLLNFEPKKKEGGNSIDTKQTRKVFWSMDGEKKLLFFVFEYTRFDKKSWEALANEIVHKYSNISKGVVVDQTFEKLHEVDLDILRSVLPA